MDRQQNANLSISDRFRACRTAASNTTLKTGDSSRSTASLRSSRQSLTVVQKFNVQAFNGHATQPSVHVFAIPKTWKRVATSAAVYGGFLLYQTTNFPLLRLRRRHKLADRVEYNLELSVVFPFQVGQFSSQLCVRCEHLTQPNKGAHNLNINLHCPLAAKHTGKHGDSVLIF
jgi:hypothetical protein